MVVGFYDSTTANQVDAVSFVYDEGGVSTGSTASANWQVVTSSNSTRTWTTTTTAVGAGTWVKLGIIVNAAGTSVGFYINGTLVATHTANIPTGTTRALGFGSQIPQIDRHDGSDGRHRPLASRDGIHDTAMISGIL